MQIFSSLRLKIVLLLLIGFFILPIQQSGSSAYASHEKIKKQSRQRKKPLEYTSIKASRVNIRTGPDRMYKKIMEIKNIKLPISVMVLGEKNGWLLIRCQNNVEGWIKKSFTSKSIKFGRSNFDKTKVCRLPTNKESSCEAIAILKKGAEVKIIKCYNGWCRIRVNSKISGWIKGKFLWGVGN